MRPVNKYGHNPTRQRLSESDGDNDNSKSTDASKLPRPKNPAVYVTNLPRDTESEELIQWSSKCGVTEEGSEGEPQIKMDAREDEPSSREALIVFFEGIPRSLR